jgi:hypothetical protein
MAVWSQSSEQECVKRLSQYGVEKLHNRSTAQANGVGENPLNGKGMLLFFIG